MRNGSSVQDRIVLAAKQEFLNHGFKDASLRRIASTVGMTTGAIYTHFRDKQDLFDMVVSPVTEQLENVFTELSRTYYNDEGIINEISYEKTIADLTVVYDFIYKNFDVFRILLLGSSGSTHEDFIHVLVNQEVRHTQAYLDRLNMWGSQGIQLDPSVMHTISEGYINALLEPVRHGMTHQQALGNLDFIVTFYTGGWLNVFGRCCLD
ncbi:TetR/AcrR family transcriptional regulator [uncultured Sphaerochaeta sp.]|uniref:TetR/AcrR family transcriptional regulator n=1 Tax=uncultured Sphaerochaeta sp. TaxID=886478 RepID=UPI002A0A88AB|nr:TetR/AcrR family transcriptional regulator [uncultured Sphaerochaeta sp.]